MGASCALGSSAPAELVVHIFQYCDSLADLRAILWHVGPKAVPMFEQALMAVRATALVHDAHRDGLLPPEIRLHDIEGAARKPSLEELRDILDLHHLVQCVEIRYCNVTLPEEYVGAADDYERWPRDRVPPPPLNTPEEPSGMRVWRDRFHAAAYITLLMGTVFARTYHRPFYPYTASRSENEEEWCRWRLFNLMRKASFGHAGYSYLGVEEEEREYLRRFPVYDLNDELGGQKEVFGPVIEWFVRLALLQFRAGPPPPSRDMLRDEVRAATLEAETGMDPSPPGRAWMHWPESGLMTQWFHGGSAAEGEAILWLTMQAIHMFEFILSCIANSDGKRRLGRPKVRNPRTFSGKTRTAKVVLFGVFQAEEILMPDNVMDSADQQLLAHTPRSSDLEAPVGHEEKYLTAFPPILDIPLVLEDLYQRSGIANMNHDENAAPPPLQFFTFLLRHHFNLQFHKKLFGTSWRQLQDYHFFKNRATIFANGPDDVLNREWSDYTNGTEFLVEYQAPHLAYLDKDAREDINPRAWALVPNCAFY
ncbi:hypothetical protein GQ53DRAFT_876770 [Thozetella sp. PMI_491]|nr:hypothetical protein GQ53DRAFT_876770 [Thozetella sp. PMI_491]